VKGRTSVCSGQLLFYFIFCGQILSFFSSKELGIFWNFFFLDSVKYDNFSILLERWKDSPNFYIKIGAKKTPPSM
jgi:hypothetical protein